MQGKEGFISLENQNKPVIAIAKISQGTKSTDWQFQQYQTPGRPQGEK